MGPFDKRGTFLLKENFLILLWAFFLKIARRAQSFLHLMFAQHFILLLLHIFLAILVHL